VDSEYVWNKIIQEQTQSNTYTDPHSISKKGPRGPSCKSFDDCVMFHLLTVFPNNAAEQERYYLTNILKKPQRVSMHQFVQRVEQLNSYIVQLPCWYYSSSVKPNKTLANVPFTKADPASHILWMCPLTWQDQFNLHKKGMTPIDMHLFLQSLQVIEHVCTQEKSNTQSGEKPSNKCKKGNKQPGSELTITVPKKTRTKKHYYLCKKHGGAHTMHNIRDCLMYEKDGTKKVTFHATKKVEKKPNPARQSFTQLSKKLDKLQKVIKKSNAKS
jgi:hypothetical protein